ncbi:MAG TPA: DUF6457 domain-containing protein [Actinospica sp.]|nr:DUF6457 domain-containing protein [Actinospica sp.]
MFEDWLTEAAAITGRPELNLSPDQQKLVLDLAREAAHGVARPAAPLTTFLAGYALGAEGGLDRLAALVADLSAAAQARSGDGEG